MSADNGIYILQTKDGFRVAHAQAIENINYMSDDTGFNLRRLYQYFHESKLYSTKNNAVEKAVKLYEEIMQDDFCPIIEYGISFINASHIDFPKECPPCCENLLLEKDEYGNNKCSNCGTRL